jgi:tRNA(fMet)-specific endonuclease VapC
VLILDTDHLAEFQKGTSADAQRLKQRLDQTDESFATTIITVEEVMRGWLAAIRRTTDPFRQISPYQRLRQLFRFFATWDVLDWSNAAAAKFAELKASKVRVGTMDLKIASIALVNEATLLTRNLNDFEHIPGLRVFDWLS